MDDIQLPNPSTSFDIDNTDPVSLYNHQHSDHAKNLLTAIGWTQDEDGDWMLPDKSLAGNWIDGLVVSTTKHSAFKRGCRYTPFQILVMLKFKGNYRAAFEWIVAKYFSEEIPYMRIGTDYFKSITKIDRYGIDRTELKAWTESAIKLDHGKTFLNNIPHFDDFTIRPDNFNYQPVVGNCYNLYRPFPHSPKQGEWKWTEVLLRHIFGEQYNLGIRYLQILYLHPERLMPILVLVSKPRQTGKTTFVNWLNMVFTGNVANVSPDDLINGFNSSYAASNIIAVEETMFEKKLTVEKLKALATTKFLTVNQKFVSQYNLPFFGKIILTSNNEDKFARIDQEEIRFFVRKIPLPTVINHDIEQDMVKEIPAFLHYLTTQPPIDFTLDRSGFTPQELENDSLRAVKEESRSELCQELTMIFEDLFLNELKHLDEFEVDAKAVKEKYFARDNRIGPSYIRRVLKDEIKAYAINEPGYFMPFSTEAGKMGRVRFVIRRQFFTKTPVKVIPF